MTGLGLLAAFTNVPHFLEDEFHDWYVNEHIPQRMAVAGFLGASRYKAVDADVPYLALYDLESSSVLRSRDYVRLLEFPTRWTVRLRPYVVGPATRRIYDLTSDAAPHLPIGLARGLRVETFDVPEVQIRHFEEWYGSTYLPRLRAIAGVLSIRTFFMSTDDPSRVAHASTDRGSPHTPAHLLLAEATSAEVFGLEPFMDLQFTSASKRIELGLSNIGLYTYRKIYEYPQRWKSGERRFEAIREERE